MLGQVEPAIAAGNAFIRTFKVTAGTVDNCHDSDGIDASAAANMATGFAQGMFICTDTTNRPPSGSQGNEAPNYKMVPMELIADMTAPVPPTVVTVPQETTSTTAPIQVGPDRSGYWMVGTDGRVYAFGDAKTYGDAVIPAGAPTPWLVHDSLLTTGKAQAFPPLPPARLRNHAAGSRLDRQGPTPG